MQGTDQTQQTQQGQDGIAANAANNPKWIAVKVRWDVQMRTMQQAVKAGNEERVEVCRTHILSIAAAAEALGMTNLGKPPAEIAEDSVFDGLDLVVKTAARAQGTNIGQTAKVKLPSNNGGSNILGRVDSIRSMTSIPKSQLKSDIPKGGVIMALGKKATPIDGQQAAGVTDPDATLTGEAAKSTKSQALKAINAANKKAGKEAVAIAPKKKADAPKVVGPCLCGCGGETTSKFIPGHDAKLKSLLIKIERAVEPIETLPEVARPYVTFKKGVMETQDIGGKAVKVQLYTLVKSPVRVPGRGDIEFVENR